MSGQVFSSENSELAMRTLIRFRSNSGPKQGMMGSKTSLILRFIRVQGSTTTVRSRLHHHRRNTNSADHKRTTRTDHSITTLPNL